MTLYRTASNGVHWLKNTATCGLPFSTALARALSSRVLPRPIFVVGAGRAGTTALCRALGTHPAILASTRESPLAQEIGQIAFHCSESPEHEYYCSSSKVPKQFFFQDLRRMLFEAMWGPNYGLRFFASQSVFRPAAAVSKRHWVAKVFTDERAGRGLACLYPQAKFIYIHRNGIENVASQERYPSFREQSFEHHCRHWADCVDRYRYLTKWRRALTITHAEVLRDRAQTYAQIFAFLGVQHSDEPARFGESTLVHPLDSDTKQGVDVSTILRRRIGAYREWPEQQRTQFHEICGDGMRELGYEIPTDFARRSA